MSKTKSMRATIYFEPKLHEALRVKAARSHQSISDLVNAAVRQVVDEDAEDLAAIEARVAEPIISYGELLASLEKGKKIDLDGDLLEAIDKLSQARKTTPAALVRETLVAELDRERTRIEEQRHIDGYARQPVQPGEFDVWFDEQAWEAP